MRNSAGKSAEYEAKVRAAVGTVTATKRTDLAKLMEEAVRHDLDDAFAAGLSTMDIDRINAIRKTAKDRVKKAYGVQ